MRLSSEQKNSYLNSGILLLTATIWGLAFIAQSVAMDVIGPLTFAGARSVLAVLALTPVVLVLRRRGAVKLPTETGCNRKTFLEGGIVCGSFLFMGMALQQTGLVYTTVGKAGFITTFYVVLVPLMGMLFGRHVGGRVWVAVGLAVAGLYYLSMTPGDFSVARGDLYVLASAFGYSMQIICVAHYVQKIDGVLLSYMEMAVCAFWGVAMAVPFEAPTWTSLLQAAMPIIYAGVGSSAIGYTLQIIGQKGVNPAVASLILSLESAISAIFAWVLLNQAMSGREILGCVLMFAAILVSQLPAEWFLRKRRI